VFVERRERVGVSVIIQKGMSGAESIGSLSDVMC